MINIVELERYRKALIDYNDENCEYLDHGFCLYFSKVQGIFKLKEQLPTLYVFEPDEFVKVWYEPGQRYDNYWFEPGDKESRIKILEQTINEMTNEER